MSTDMCTELFLVSVMTSAVVFHNQHEALPAFLNHHTAFKKKTSQDE